MKLPLNIPKNRKKLFQSITVGNSIRPKWVNVDLNRAWSNDLCTSVVMHIYQLHLYVYMYILTDKRNATTIFKVLR